MALKRLAIVLVLAASACAQNYKITTFAGDYAVYGKTGGFGGDGGVPTLAGLHWPCEIVFDSAGNLYFVDLWNERVRAVNIQATTQTLYGVSIPAGAIKTIAGNGTACNTLTCGDGGPATSGMFKNPVGIAIDGSGNLYIADQQNAAIRKISTSGTLSTVVGVMQDSNYFPGDGIPVSFALTAVANASGGTTSYTGTISTIPSNTTYIYVQGFSNAANNGRFQVAAGSTSTTLVLTNTAGVAETHAGTANWAALDYPQGVAVDSAGNIYVADTQNHRIRAMNTQATTQTLMGVSIPANNINVVAGNGCVINGQTGCYAGDGGAGPSAALNTPLGMGFDGSGNLYWAEDLNNIIRKLSTSGTISTFAGGKASISISGVSNVANVKTYTYTLTSGPALTVNSYISILGCTSSHNNGTFLITGFGSGTFTVANSPGVTEAESGATGISGVRNYSGDGGAATAATLNQPFDVKVDSAGNVYIADQGNNLIRKVALGTITTIAGDFAVYGTDGGYAGDDGLSTRAGLGCHTTPSCIQGGVGLVGVAPDDLGNIYVGDTGNNLVRKLSPFIGQTTSGGGLTVTFCETNPPSPSFPVCVSLGGAEAAVHPRSHPGFVSRRAGLLLSEQAMRSSSEPGAREAPRPPPFRGERW